MKKAAVIIGESQQGSTDFRPLAGVENDLADVHGFLRHKAGYDLVHLLRDMPKAEVLRVVEDVLALLSAGDRLVLYFSGHGHGIGGEHALICRGATRSRLRWFHEAIPVNQLREMTDGLGLDRSLLIDSCWDSLYVAAHKGGPEVMTAAEAEYLRNIGTAPVEPTAAGITGSFALLCACGQDQVAVEVPALRRGLFTAAWMDVMTNAAVAGRGVMMSSQLATDIAGRMRALAVEHRLTATSQPLYSGSGEPPILLDGTLTELPSRPCPVQAPPAPAVVVPPPTASLRQQLVVSADGRGDYRTITEAIAAARPGALIRVMPGVYSGGMAIDNHVEIVGDGPVGEIVVENDAGPALTATAPDAIVRGITLRCTAGTSFFDVSDFASVEISQGRLLLEDCDINRNLLGKTCVAVHGPQANPTLRRCKIHDGGFTGVWVYDRGMGTFEDCDVSAPGTGVHIEADCDPVLRRCKIHACEHFGVLAAKGTFEDCDVFAITDGIGFVGSGEPIVRRCKIHGCETHGVYVGKGRGTFENCELWANPGGNFEILNGCMVRRVGNRER